MAFMNSRLAFLKVSNEGFNKDFKIAKWPAQSLLFSLT